MFSGSSRLAGNDPQRWPEFRIAVEILHAVMLVEMCDRLLTNSLGGIPGLAVLASRDHMIAHVLVHTHTRSSLVSMPAIVAGRVRSCSDARIASNGEHPRRIRRQTIVGGARRGRGRAGEDGAIGTVSRLCCVSILTKFIKHSIVRPSGKHENRNEVDSI